MKLAPGDSKVKIVPRLYERMNVSETCRSAIAKYSKQALKALKGTSLSEETREPFRALLDKLTGRKK